MGQLLTEPELKVFEHLLDGYQPDFGDLEVFRRSNFVVLAGPAGAGKDTLRNALIQKNQELYVPIISTTTRPVRAGEQDGREYHFRSPSEVQANLLDKQFFQAVLVHNQQVSCLDGDEIRKLHSGQIGLSIMIVQQEEALQMLKSDLKTIFLIPPSIETLKLRMQANRSLSEDEFTRRLEAAKIELAFALNKPHYYCLLSDEVEKMTDSADAYLREGQWDEDANQAARRVIEKILNELSI